MHVTINGCVAIGLLRKSRLEAAPTIYIRDMDATAH